MVSVTRCFYRRHLSEQDAKIYDNIEAGIRICSDHVMVLEKVDADRLSNIVEHIRLDHPEFYYWDYFATKFANDAVWTIIMLFYYGIDAERLSYEKKLNAEIQKSISECFPDGYKRMSDIRKEKMIFDWVTKSIVYNHEALDSWRTKDDSSFQVRAAWTLYGAIVHRKAVCLGIAYAYQVLCEMVGIECFVVGGDTAEGLHAWNLVKIGGEYYHTDCTWDLRESTPLNIPYNRYRYFNLPDAVIRTNHFATSAFLPACTAVQYNPFHMKGFCARSVEELVEIVFNAFSSKRSRFAILCMGFAMNDERTLALVREMSNTFHRSIMWSCDEGGHFIGMVLQ